MTRVERVFAPDPATHATYNALYAEVYKRLYGRLRPLYETLRRLSP
jgi:sugar (pentulose or hexulose) kinase